MQIVTVTGYKGGVSKSTTAIHLAAFFSDRGKTILIDGDPNRTAVNWGARGKGLPFTVADDRQAMRLIAGHDFAVIDTPARPNSDDLKELAKGCDLLVLPTPPDVLSLEPMLQVARDLGEGANYRALVTIVPPKPSREGEQLQADLREAGIPVFDATVRRTVNVAKAALVGVTARDIKNPQASALWNDYKAVGKEILDLLSQIAR